jgi:hypothetical protein
MDGLGLKIAILYFLGLSLTSLKYVKCCRRHRQKFINTVSDNAKKILALLPTALKIFYGEQKPLLTVVKIKNSIKSFQVSQVNIL